jgi:hypothetical protein
MANDGQGNSEHGIQGSTVARAAAAAAATGAAAYAINRVRSHRESDEPAEREEQETNDDNGGGGVLAKKDDLAQTLTSKASDVKERASKLRPKRRKNDAISSIAGTAWESAAQHLVPVAGQAAAAAGEALAQRSPDLVRDELMPKFIEGFQKGS